ncbi:hypothetical protein LguiA_030069 [Lonicera macranthoides]
MERVVEAVVVVWNIVSRTIVVHCCPRFDSFSWIYDSASKASSNPEKLKAKIAKLRTQLLEPPKGLRGTAGGGGESAMREKEGGGGESESSPGSAYAIPVGTSKSWSLTSGAAVDDRSLWVELEGGQAYKTTWLRLCSSRMSSTSRSTHVDCLPMPGSIYWAGEPFNNEVIEAMIAIPLMQRLSILFLRLSWLLLWRNFLRHSSSKLLRVTFARLMTSWLSQMLANLIQGIGLLK